MIHKGAHAFIVTSLSTVEKGFFLAGNVNRIQLFRWIA